MSFTLPLPPTEANSEVTYFQNNGIVVIVGANGSGKTRYGSWLEFDTGLNSKVRRVTAQRILTFPQSVVSESVDASKRQFETGINGESTDWGLRKISPSYFNSKPSILPLNDYENLLKYLFAEENETSVKYRQDANTSPNRMAINPSPETKLDSVKEIWESVHIHRKLVIGGGKVEVRPSDGGSLYNASEMSDGERVSFYLIAQCLLAEKEGIILIDEPELHLHRSVQSKLWNAIEAKRKDCQFVYLTHDLDFAASRSTAEKLWFKEYKKNIGDQPGSEKGSVWEWIEIPQDTDLPDELILNVIGSRKPVLFVEGDKSSDDFLIYDHYYRDYTVIPRGGCTQVISSTVGFNGLTNLHEFDCKGIIDSDHRTESQIAKLASQGIHAIKVSEVENLLLTEEILAVIEKGFHFEPNDSKIPQAKKVVLDYLEHEKAKLIGSIAQSKLNAQLPRIKKVYEDEQSFVSALDDTFADIKPKDIYESATKFVEEAQKDYTRALEIFNNKGLVARVAELYGLDKAAFTGLFKRLLGTEHDEAIRAALARYLPAI